MMHIGVVHYRIRSTGDAFDAVWYTTSQSIKETGTGIVKGDLSNGFPGEHIITYFRADGSEVGNFDLTIEKTGSIYDLSWNRDGEQLFVGVGIDTSDGMVAGFRKVE